MCQKMKKYTRILAALVLPLLLFFSTGTPTHATYNRGSALDTRVSSRIWELIFGEAMDVSESEELCLIPGGDIFGVRISEGKVTVIEDNAAVGVRQGDIIRKVEGQKVSTVSEVREIVESDEDGIITLSLSGSSGECDLKINTGEERRLGISIRDGAAGIGTVTYIDPNNHSFGGLGHGICEPDTKRVIEISSGVVSGVILGGIEKGEKGHPGELRGILTNKREGEISKNTSVGVFGRLEGRKTDTASALPIGKASEVHAGAAKIISTVKNGRKAEYSVEIFEVDKTQTGSKCFKVKVTDPTLLALTGGIVKGMSGSPIIQDGKLVGAVTHVLVGDPTVGYGIFIENMLGAAQQDALPKAA